MKVIHGHLTQTEKKAIKLILKCGYMDGVVGRKTYFLKLRDEIYEAYITQKDRGLVSVGGSQLRISTYKSKFIL